jgi:hypothetical protein
MFTKTTFALALALATASSALAATKSQSIVPSQETVYNPAGDYIGTDPDLNIRFELKRDLNRGY